LYYKKFFARNQVKRENLSTKLEKNSFLRYSLSIARSKEKKDKRYVFEKIRITGV